MGTYVQLDCLDCRTTLSFGKPIAIGNNLTLRLFSEDKREWRDGIECWNAVQKYLLKHTNHKIVFRSDDSLDSQCFASEATIIEFDELISEWNVGV